jgi:hypothetical protein
VKKIAFLLSTSLVALIAISAAPAKADGINALASQVGQTISMTVEPYASGENNGAYYVGLTQVNTATTGGTPIASLEAFCDDFTHEISVPDTYNAVVEAVAGTTLEQEAYYGMEFGSTPSGNSVLDSELQELIWNFTAPLSQQYGLNSAMLALQQNMLANYQNVNYSNSYYLNAGNAGQSFMVTGISPTPEPSSLILAFTGLCAILYFGRRRLFQTS